MGVEPWLWSFEEFQSPSGRNSISDWRRGLSPARRAVMDVFFDRIAKMEKWPTGMCDPIRGHHPGCWELRWVAEKVQHRIFGYYSGDRLFVMLIGCTHKQQVYDPPEAFQTLKDRKRKISQGEGAAVRYEPQQITGD